MGSGASALGSVDEAPPEKLQAAMASLSTEDQRKLKDAFDVGEPKEVQGHEHVEIQQVHHPLYAQTKHDSYPETLVIGDLFVIRCRFR